ncbi:lipopolysaccharide biosynthesis protein [Sphingomonas sp. SM33]|uniref:Lipopolysaccharide biosynthesis protein n=1 Tax=Sphingomonas telluris TaxID=2907998 RepID=A0ABS9VI79_9SPHN|nr:lipopolysaccharide biosynthesis protein [Sphingomonas telluris]MCH8614685.1 lipopolysaccharide biosynthesis protein [Sphingomonas telluris]
METTTIERAESGGGAWLINHLPTILWHRRLYVIISFVVLFLAGLITAFTLPTLYRSSATMLVESQDLSTDVVEAPGAGKIEERIAKIRERVLSRGDLISVIEQNDLYPTERRSKPMSYVVDKMRKATTVGALSGDIGSGGDNKSDVIAIKMDYDYPDPAKAQAVMQAYVTQFLRMDSEQVEDQANLTVRFLTDQASKLQSQIQAVEGQITALKASNGSALASAGGPAFVDTGSYTAQIANLENQNRQLLSQSNGTGGDSALSQAEAALAAAQAMYSDSHPDVIAAKERVATLRRAQGPGSVGPSASVQEQIRANNAAIAQLNAARNAAVGRANASMAGQARAPAIMERAMQLENQANTLRAQYKTIADDLLKAQSGARLANEQRAERLSLVEPPNLPDTPHWPNRPIVIGAGAAAGLGFGLLLALLIELLNRPMRSPAQLQAMGLPVLGVVPILQSKPGKKRFSLLRRKREPRLA